MFVRTSISNASRLANNSVPQMWGCNQQALQQHTCAFSGAGVGCKRPMPQRHRGAKRLQVVAVGWVRLLQCCPTFRALSAGLIVHMGPLQSVDLSLFPE